MEIKGTSAGRISAPAQHEINHAVRETSVAAQVRPSSSMHARANVVPPPMKTLGGDADSRSIPRGIAPPNRDAPMPVETMSSEVLLMLRGLREPDAAPTNVIQSTATRRAPTRGASPPASIPISKPPPDLRPGATPEATAQKARVARATSGQLGFSQVVLEAADALAGAAQNQEVTRSRRSEPIAPPAAKLRPLTTEGIDSGLKRARKSPLQTVREHIRESTNELAKPALKGANKGMVTGNMPTFGEIPGGVRHQPQAMVRSASGALELQPLLGKAPDLNPRSAPRTALPTAHMLEARIKPLVDVRPLSGGGGASSSAATGESTLNRFEPLQFGGGDSLFMMGNNAAPFVADSSMTPMDVAKEAFQRGPLGEA